MASEYSDDHKIDGQLFSASDLHDEALHSFQLYSAQKDLSFLDRSIQLLQQAKCVAQNGPPQFASSHSLTATRHDLSKMLANRYMHKHVMADLCSAINEVEATIATCQSNDPSRPEMLATVSYLLGLQYNRTRSDEDLDRIIDWSRQAVFSLPAQSGDCQEWRANLSSYLLDRDQNSKTAKPDDLDSAIEVAESFLRVSENQVPDQQTRAKVLITLSSALYAKFERTEKTSALTRAIQVTQQILTFDSTSHAFTYQTMENLVVLRAQLFLCTDCTDDLHNALDAIKQLQTSAQSASKNAFTKMLDRLDGWLVRRLHRSGTSKSPESFVLLVEEIWRRWPMDPTAPFCLGKHLLMRSNSRMQGSESDIHRALEVLKSALELTDQNDDLREPIMSMLSSGLSEKFSYSRSPEDIETAMLWGNRAKRLPNKSNTRRMTTLTLVSDVYFQHYKASEDIGSLDESVASIEEVIAMASPNNPERPQQRQLYAEILLARYEAKHDAQDLDRAIESNERATAMITDNAPLAAAVDGGLAGCLRRRFERTGDIDDLNLAIDKASRVVDSSGITPAYRGQMTANLATFLSLRYHYLGILEDLNRALHAQEAVIENVRLSDNDLILGLMKLSNTYSNRFIRLRSQSDVDEAVKVIRRAIDLGPSSHLQRARCWVALAHYLLQRSLLDTNPQRDSDLDDGIAYLDQYMPEVPLGDPGRLDADMDLARGLRSRFSRRRTPVDINRSLEILSNASTRLEPGHTLRADVFFQLGLTLETRRKYIKVTAQKDCEAAIEAFSECFKSSAGIRITRVSAADLGSHILESMGRWKEALDLLQGALQLFSAIATRTLPRSDQQFLVRRFSGISSRAAAIALNAGLGAYDALKLLELGRGVMASLVLERRVDTGTLGEDMASQYEGIQAKLEISRTSAGLSDLSDLTRWVERSQETQEADKRLEEMLATVRAQPETKTFLQAPSSTEIIEAAGNDTIVVLNESQSGCDAFLISKEQGITHISLNNLRQPDIQRWVQRLRVERPQIDMLMLEWLWTAIAEPVLRALGFEDSPSQHQLPRVWWIMAGRMSHLPIHAAGFHSCRSTTVLGRVTSAYAMSLRALVTSRANISANKTLPTYQKALLVGMPTTPGYRDLPLVAEEIRNLSDLVPSLGLEAVELNRPKVEDIKAVLQGCSIFHFAGHGLSHSYDPSESGLLLNDGLLTVSELQENLNSSSVSFLAVLSACLTGAVDVDELVDEGIHLISACQLAGFRHVIGTLWQVYDKTCIHVVDGVYRALIKHGITDEAVVLGLHEVITNLRDKWAEQYFRPSDPESTYVNGQEEEEQEVTLILKKTEKPRLFEGSWIPFVCYAA